MIEPNGWPRDSVSLAARVVRLIDEVDQCSEERRDELLCAMLSAAWGSAWAQNQ
jgi:hypothetical protein